MLIWDVAKDPTRPRLLAHYRTGGTGTHRNFYAGGRCAYLAASPAEHHGLMLVVLDLEDPTRPREAARWSWPGQCKADSETADHSFYFHGPAYVIGDRAYLSYGRVGMVILDVGNPSSPRLVSSLSFGDLGSALGCHTALPLPGRGLAVVNSEAIIEGLRQGGQVRAAQPAPSPGPPALGRLENVVLMTYFNAGLRIYDIHDPYAPAEVAYYVPEDPPERLGPKPEQALVTQFEDVLVDARGFIYCTDKNYGLFVLRYQGELS